MTVRRVYEILIASALLACACLPVAHSADLSEDKCLTSSRSVNALAMHDGDLWAATRGGVLRYTKVGKWIKYTRADGLPSNEALGIYSLDNVLKVYFPNDTAVWDGAKWTSVGKREPMPGADAFATRSAYGIWKGHKTVATPEFLNVEMPYGWGTVSYPNGDFIVTGFAPRGDNIIATVRGDGLWECDSYKWWRFENALPAEAGEATSVAVDGGNIWVGTFDKGVWRFDGGKWSSFAQAGEPPANDFACLASFGGALYSASKDIGMVVFSGDSWKAVSRPDVSTNSVRQIVEFKGDLYVRHASGVADRLHNGAWERNVFKDIPGRQVSAISACGDRLLIAHSGGWSEYDGKSLKSHTDIEALQNEATTAIFADGGKLWIGTKKRGIVEIDRRTMKAVSYDAGAGLGDPWVKCIAGFGGDVYIGTSKDGLAALKNGKVSAAAEPGRVEITDFAVHGGRLIVGTRSGAWAVGSDGVKAFKPELIDPDVMSVLSAPGGVWVGTRDGLYFVADK